MASSSAAVIIQPQVNSTDPPRGGQGQQVLHELVAGAGPVDADQDLLPEPGRDLPDRRGSTSLWSANVFDPALPGRRSMARHSRVLASRAPSGWKP